MKKSILFLLLSFCLQQSFAQWTRVYQHPTRKNLQGITFVDSITGYACGDSGVVLKTLDRG